MKPTDFSSYLTRFLSKYLPDEAGFSTNTISSYRDTFILLLRFIKEVKNIKVQNIYLDMFTKSLITDFLYWIENQRNCSVSTRNVRLAAVHSFFCFLQYENPDNLLEWQKILTIPVKKAEKKILNYISPMAIKTLLEMPDVNNRKGQRDLVLLSLMYETGARVQEIIDLTPSAVRFEQPYIIKLIGKGKKSRIVPLIKPMTVLLKQYMEEYRLIEPYANQEPLFQNKRNEKLTRAGVNYILKKYVKMVRNKNRKIIPDTFSCHSVRHSKAMHMLQAGVNLVYIRDILGHSSVQTTEIYARADSKQKREAIEKAYNNTVPDEMPTWQKDENLLEWLTNFNK